MAESAKEPNVTIQEENYAERQKKSTCCFLRVTLRNKPIH